MNVRDGASGGVSSTKSKTLANPTIDVSTSSSRIIYPESGTIPWMRYLYIEFGNSEGKTFGVGGYDDSLSIVVTGTKTLASVGDNANIKIYNLPVIDALKITQGGYTQSVKIYCGYYNTTKIKIFDGGVVYTEEGKTSRNTSVINIQCSHRLVSDRLQSRLSLSYNSGYNLFRIAEEVSNAFGVGNQLQIDECLKEDELKYELSKNGTFSEWLEGIINASSKDRSYAISTSAKTGIVSIMGYRQMGSGDTYVINTRDVNLQTFPTLSSEGLRITLSPVYNMAPGDIISIDNTSSALISSIGQTNDLVGNQKYIDKDGLYNIREMNYTLENRGDTFTVEVLAISKSLLNKMMLGEKVEEKAIEEYKTNKGLVGGSGGHYTK